MQDVFYQRRSVRKYKDIPVEKEKIDQILSAGLLAPSARNLHSPQFIVVTDKEKLRRLGDSREQMSSFIGNAALAIVILGDSNAIDIWIEDSTIAASFMMVAAQSLGIGACWVQIRNRKHNEETTAEDYVKEVLGIPEEIQVECILSMGYPDETKRARTYEDLKLDKVFYEKYGVNQ